MEIDLCSEIFEKIIDVLSPQERIAYFKKHVDDFYSSKELLRKIFSSSKITETIISEIFFAIKDEGWREYFLINFFTIIPENIREKLFKRHFFQIKSVYGKIYLLKKILPDLSQKTATKSFSHILSTTKYYETKYERLSEFWDFFSAEQRMIFIKKILSECNASEQNELVEILSEKLNYEKKVSYFNEMLAIESNPDTKVAMIKLCWKYLPQEHRLVAFKNVFDHCTHVNQMDLFEYCWQDLTPELIKQYSAKIIRNETSDGMKLLLSNKYAKFMKQKPTKPTSQLSPFSYATRFLVAGVLGSIAGGFQNYFAKTSR